MKFASSVTLVLLVCIALGNPAAPEENTSTAAGQAEQLLSGKSWEEFCERLKRLGNVVRSEGVPSDEIDRAEGYRYLLAALAESIDVALYRSDLSDPQLRFNVTKYRAPAMPSSDARYLSSEITGTGTYRLSGKLGNSPHITVQAYGGVNALESFDIKGAADAEGHFSFTISGAEGTSGAIKISREASMLFFREYFSDWKNAQASTFILERLDRPARGTPLEPSMMAQVLEATAIKLERQIPYWKGRIDQIRRGHDNSLAPPGLMGDVGLGDILYGTGWFDLEPDEAMLIELAAPDAVHWSFQLGNYWGEFLDFANFTSSINGHQAVPSSDGLYRIVIARTDPGVPNWLDTAGHREGMIFYRYHLAKSKPIPTARLVKLSDLPGVLPPDTPSVSAEERRAEIDGRRAAIVQRWAP
jgi:hypothetical protein